MLIREVLEKAALDWGEREAIVSESVSMSYVQLNKSANKIAQCLLSLGVQKGAKVAFMYPNNVEFVATLFAVYKAGAIGVPMNTRLAPEEIRFILEHSEAKICLFDSMYLDRIECIMNELPPDFMYIQSRGETEKGFINLEEYLSSASEASPKMTCPDTEMIFFYTSGTTGNPKGVILDTEKFIDYTLDDKAFEFYPLTTEDRAYLSTPLFHISSAIFLLKVLNSGTCCYITKDWKAERALKLIQDACITFMWTVPTMLILMQKHPKFGDFDLSCLRQIIVGGSQLHMDPIRIWKNAGPNLRISNGYAQTETSATGSRLDDDFILKKPLSIGLPNYGIEMKIVDDEFSELPSSVIGEIAIKSPANMIGYYRNPELTAKTLREEWCLTGDTGYVDEEGFFYYTGRKKDMIIRGGENIFPDEIEALINQHPSVLESAVIGISDPVMGEEVLAVVVLKPGAQIAPEKIISHCEEAIADYKVPKYVRMVQELPKTSTQKIKKQVLREQFSV